MCALAAPASSIYSSLRETLYQSARKLLQDFELNDQSLDKVTLPQAQTWLLISTYEMLHGFIQRSLMSTSRAVRLVQMMRLHRVDAPNLNRDPIPDALGVPKDWTETEERRRLFWATFLMDRYAGISMGWPTLIDSRDVSYFPKPGVHRIELKILDSHFPSCVERGIRKFDRAGHNVPFRLQKCTRCLFAVIIRCYNPLGRMLLLQNSRTPAS